MRRVRVLPYKTGSTSAKRLAEALGGKRLRAGASKFQGAVNDVIINWGNKTPPPLLNLVGEGRMLNWPENIPNNKLDFYQQNEKLVPAFTTSIDIATAWLLKNGAPRVVCRTLLNASGGRGITVARKIEELVVNARVYVKYIKKFNEYRIHFMNGGIFFVQQKKMRDGEEGANFEIRNHDNGFVFCHKDIDLPWCVPEICQVFVNTTRLDFGALDVLYNQKNEKAYLLEVNTAPGLEGDTTLQSYVDAFKIKFDNMKEKE